MLCLTDEVDEFVMNILMKEGDRDYCSINSDHADLLDEEDTKKAEESAEENKDLLSFIKETLSISDAVISRKLVSQPVCLSAKGSVTLDMEKYFASLPGEQGGGVKAERVLELNASHAAFAALKKAYETDQERAATMVRVLYGQALLIAGLPVEDPTGYAQDVCSLFE